MCMEARQPICTSKRQRPVHPPAQQHNVHEDISAQLFIQSYLPAAERNLETGSFHNIWVRGWAEFRLSDPQPTPGFWSDEHWCRYHTYAIPNSFLTQAVIKCSMSWHIIQLGLKEPGWKWHSLQRIVYYEPFPWPICSQTKLKELNTVMYLLNTVHSKATASMTEEKLFMDHWKNKNKLQLPQHSCYSTLSQAVQDNESNQLQQHYPSLKQTLKSPLQVHQCLARDVVSPSWDAHSLNLLVQRRAVGGIQTPAHRQGGCSPGLHDGTCQHGHFCVKCMRWGRLGLLWCQLSLMNLTALFSNWSTSVQPLWLLKLQMLGYFQYMQLCLICGYRLGEWLPNLEVWMNRSASCFTFFTDSKQIMVVWIHVK